MNYGWDTYLADQREKLAEDQSAGRDEMIALAICQETGWQPNWLCTQRLVEAIRRLEQ